MTDTLDALERLARLHQSGALTDAEFSEQKARVLRSSGGGGGGGADRAVYRSDDDVAPDSSMPASKLIIAGLGAVLLGVLLWWQLVDGEGQLKPIPTPGTAAESGKAGIASAAPSTAPTPSEAAAVTSAAEASAAPQSVPFSPSFACAGQDEPTLVMICEDRFLSRKDRDLSDRFKAVLRSLDETDREALLRRQRAFLRERSACQDTACLHDWYDRTLEFYS